MAEQFVDVLTAHHELVLTTAPDVIDAPEPLRRRDGTSVYTQPAPQRWARASTIDRERWLLDVADGTAGRPVADVAIETACRDHGLGAHHVAAVEQLLGADRRVGLLIGPAGAGKTRILRAAVDEASMISTGDLVQIVEQTHRARRQGAAGR